MQMIADAAELSVGKIYLHFEGKQAIFDETFAHHESLLRRRMEDSCEDFEDPLALIRCRIRAATKYIGENVEFLRFYRRDAATGDLIARHGEEHERHFDELTNLLREGIRRGLIEDGDPEMLAAMIEGAVHHMMLLVLEREDKSFDEVPEYLDRYLLAPLESGRAKSTLEDEG